MSEYDTKPTIETVLERMEAGFAGLNLRLDAIESRLEAIENDALRQDEKIDLFIREVLEMKRRERMRA
jgi:hypothetical protein